MDGTRFVSSCIFVNGLMSCLNHYTGMQMAHFLDGVTMYLPLFFVFTTLLSKYVTFLYHWNQLQSFKKNDRSANNNVNNSNLNNNKEEYYYNNHYYFRWCARGTSWSIGMIIITLNIWNDSMEEPNDLIFLISFTIPLWIMGYLGWKIGKDDAKLYQYFHYLHVHDFNKKSINIYHDNNIDNIGNVDPDIPGHIKIVHGIAHAYFIRGQLVCFVCCATWYSYEFGCNANHSWLPYIPVHFVFHFAMAYGISLVILYFTFLECFSLGHEVYFTPMFGKNNSSKDGYVKFLNNVNLKVSQSVQGTSEQLSTINENENDNDNENDIENININDHDRKRYFISQKIMKQIVKSLDAYKFFLPQLRVADPTLTYSDAMAQIFTRYNSTDILTQIAMEMDLISGK